MENPYDCTESDEGSLAPSSNYPQSWSSQSLSASLSSMLPPSENAMELNILYLESKTEMLEIIEEGLQLKLEIQGIKDQFLNLVHDFDEYEQKDKQRALKCPTLTSDYDTGTSSSKPDVKMSAARKRVRALYEARKARIRARRSSNLADGQGRLNVMAPPKKVPKFAARDDGDDDDDDDGDKENVYRPQTDCRTLQFGDKRGRITSTPRVGASSQAPLPTMTWSIRKFLTSVRDEQHDETLTNMRCLPRNLLTPKGSSLFKRSGSRSKEKPCAAHHNGLAEVARTRPAKPQTERRKAAGSRPSSCQKQRILDNVSRTARPKCSSQSEQVCPAEDDTRTNGDYMLGPCDSYPPDQAEPSQLNDISEISLISRTDFHEQVSSANISGAFHSTFNYPLHSTLNYPLHSTFSMTNDSLPPTTEDVLSRDCTDATTTVSEPLVVSTALRRSFLRHRTPGLSLPRQALDDSCVDYNAFVSKMSTRSNTQQQAFSPSSYRTPSRKPQAELCKEHGIHPTFGGSCIFQNGDSVTLNSSDEELDQDENGNTSKATGGTIRETDCDSSYLSECLDDHQSSIDVDQYAAMYDSRLTCLKILKRQTGQVELKELKQPIGLSESDLDFEATKQDMSVEATCASVPDCNELTTLAEPAVDEDMSESTLHASSLLRYQPEATEAGDLFAGDDTLISVDQRPPSANEESPESNPAMPVPVNSPNITDSGGSSGRQNTDNYDYVDVPPPPPPQAKAASDRASLPSSQTTHSSQSCRSRKAHSSHSYHSHQTSRSHKVHRHPHPHPHHPHHQPDCVHHRHRRQYSSTPSQLHDISNGRSWKCKPLRRGGRKTPAHGTASGEPAGDGGRSRHHGYDWDSGCSSHGSRSRSKHFTISDNTGRRRTIIPDSTTPESLSHDRKHVLAKKIKVFTNSFYKTSTANQLQIQTLGHF